MFTCEKQRKYRVKIRLKIPISFAHCQLPLKLKDWVLKDVLDG